MNIKKTAAILSALGLINIQLYSQNIGKHSPIEEPYPYINAGGFSGSRVLESPDPLVSYRWVNMKAADGLEIYTLKPVKVTTSNSSSFSDLISLSGDSPAASVNGTGSIMVDFGQENAGWLEFDSPDLIDSTSIEMSISEYNEPAIVNTGAQNPVKTKVPVKYGSTYRLELNKELYEGVRFGWIHINKYSKPWHITAIRLVCQIKPTNYNGSFSCSDTMLTRIWYTGAYTVKLNLLKDYLGAILMERSDRFSWTGDAYTSQAASMAAFANYDFIKKNLENTSKQSNGIASYPLYWVLSLIEYYNYSGDKETLGSYIDNASAKLDSAYSHYGKNPDLGFYGGDERLGSYFENPNCEDAENAYKMLSIRVWREFSESMKKYGRAELYEKYTKYADEKIKELRQNGKWYNSFGLHAEADAVNAGFTTKEEQNDFFRKDFTDRVNRISYTPFNEYFVINAMAHMDKYDDAISTIKDEWGGQIKYGGTTFFEVYRPSWNLALGKNDPPINGQNGYTSLCHPWSAGVTTWLTEEVLGIKPTSPGFSTFDILPHPGSLLTNVSGNVLTPHGNISAGFNLATGLCKVSIPGGTSCRVGIPRATKEIVSININGSLVWTKSKHKKLNNIGTSSEDNNFVYFTNLKPGIYNFTVEYKGTTPGYKEPPYKYAASFIKEDSTTSGNWGGVYGAKGYILCNYSDSTNDLRKLPSFITSVNYKKNINCQWAAGSSDKRAPAANAQNNFPRNAGAIRTNDLVACDQTMTVDINVKDQQEYQVALYFVDWDNIGRRSAVEMFDLQTKKSIAPVKIVNGYYGGKYLVYKFDKSARFRIDQVRGLNAALSGIFFD
jgi:hypothetical protein